MGIIRGRLDSTPLGLETLSFNDYSEEGSLEQVRNSQVREWLASTFTRTDSAYEACKVTMSPIIRFKAAANTIIIGQYLGR